MGEPIEVTDDGDDELFYGGCWPTEDIDDLIDLDNCFMRPDGQCGKAGSEECDWDCPRRR